jgi:hypothetical protein
MFVGHGRAGKDTCCEYLEMMTTLKNAGTTSKYLCEYVAQKLNLPVEEAYRRRHESDEMRNTWYHAGNELREKGPTTLVRRALENGQITGGVRDLPEVVAAREEGLIDLIVWVSNPRVKPDPTVKFTEAQADVIVPNHWGYAELYDRVYRLAKFSDLPMRPDASPTLPPDWKPSSC